VYRTIPETRTRTETFYVCRMVPETRTRTVVYTTRRMVPETAERQVAQTTWRSHTTTRVITVPRSVPREVSYTAMRCIPRTEYIQVPVRVCTPIPQCSGGVCYGAHVKQGAPAETGAPEVLPPQPKQPEGEQPDDSEGEQPDDLEGELPDEFETRRPAPLKFAAAPREINVEFNRRYGNALQNLQQGRYGDAVDGFAAASQAEPSDAKSLYFKALAQWLAGDVDRAEETIREAARQEVQSPLKDWGRTMERIQGPQRLWLEAARKKAASANN
jgi:hypothetical protein